MSFKKNRYFLNAMNVYRNYADFNGRSTRLEYWSFFLFNWLIMFIGLLIGLLSGLLSVTISLINEELGQIVAGLLLLILLFALCIVGLASLVPGLSVSVRRLHDTNKSGWLTLLPLISLISFIPLISFIGSLFGWILLYYYCKDGDVGPNKYGLDPKRRSP